MEYKVGEIVEFDADRVISIRGSTDNYRTVKFTFYGRILEHVDGSRWYLIEFRGIYGHMNTDYIRVDKIRPIKDKKAQLTIALGGYPQPSSNSDIDPKNRGFYTVGESVMFFGSCILQKDDPTNNYTVKECIYYGKVLSVEELGLSVRVNVEYMNCGGRICNRSLDILDLGEVTDNKILLMNKLGKFSPPHIFDKKRKSPASKRRKTIDKKRKV